LTGGLAHDFNNLLAGISGGLDLIEIRLRQGRASEVGRYIDGAKAAVGRAAALTHRLLAFARRQTLDPKPTNVNQLVSNMSDLLTHTVGPNIAIEKRLAEDLWFVLCDPNQLENALLNLAINARDAMKSGGAILVETENSELPDENVGKKTALAAKASAGDYVRISVADTGAGMDPITLDHAFEPFFTTKATGEGTGLGLSMIYGFVEQSGGHVVLDSEVGKGTTVTIYLPRCKQELRDALPAEKEPKPSGVQKGVAVLLVEDEPMVRLMLVDWLSDIGYTVLEAMSGEQGLEIVKSAAVIDLLITDIGLPGGLNGRQLADATQHLRQELKILLITGYDATAALENSQLPPGMAIMTKPFNLDAFTLKIHELMEPV